MIVEGGKLFARIEAASTGPWTKQHSTDGVPIEIGTWYHVAVVKQSGLLTRYIDGRARSQIKVPWFVPSRAKEFALGGHPHPSSDPEFLAAKFADLRFLARALSNEDVKELYDDGQD